MQQYNTKQRGRGITFARRLKAASALLGCAFGCNSFIHSEARLDQPSPTRTRSDSPFSRRPILQRRSPRHSHLTPRAEGRRQVPSTTDPVHPPHRCSACHHFDSLAATNCLTRAAPTPAPCRRRPADDSSSVAIAVLQHSAVPLSHLTLHLRSARDEGALAPTSRFFLSYSVYAFFCSSRCRLELSVRRSLVRYRVRKWVRRAAAAGWPACNSHTKAVAVWMETTATLSPPHCHIHPRRSMERSYRTLPPKSTRRLPRPPPL